MFRVVPSKYSNAALTFTLRLALGALIFISPMLYFGILWMVKTYEVISIFQIVLPLIYNVVDDGLFVASIMGLTFILSHYAIRRIALRLGGIHSPRPIFLKLLSILLLSLAVYQALSWLGHFKTLTFTLYLSVGYAIVFPVYNMGLTKAFDRWLRHILSALFLIAGFFIPLNHARNIGLELPIAATVCLIGLLYIIVTIGKRYRNGKRLVQYTFRTVFILISLPIFVILFLALQPVERPNNVRQILKKQELYDIIIDKPAQRLIVSSKYSGTLFELPLDNLRTRPNIIEIPTSEAEDLALGPNRRKIYHVARNTKRVVEIDADTYKILRTKKLSVPCTGSTNIALIHDTNRLYAICEDDNFLAIDTDTLTVYQVLDKGIQPSMLADQQNKMLYIAWDDVDRIEAVDIWTNKTKFVARGPYFGNKMAICPERQELYVPAAIRGQIWVFSTPDLKLKRKIETDRGVRSIAIDNTSGLLFVISYFTGYVDLIDLDTGRRVARHYVARYGRNIAADPQRRHVFITTAYKGLFMMTY